MFCDFRILSFVQSNLNCFLKSAKYLSDDNLGTVTRQTRPISANIPEMRRGNMPNDEEHLRLTPEEKEQIILQYPNAEKFIRLQIGSNEYINSIRINEACRLLVKSDKSIKEISAEVGFGTVRSFDRVFKAKNGETAREYRQRNA